MSLPLRFGVIVDYSYLVIWVLCFLAGLFPILHELFISVLDLHLQVVKAPVIIRLVVNMLIWVRARFVALLADFHLLIAILLFILLFLLTKLELRRLQPPILPGRLFFILLAGHSKLVALIFWEVG